jgi:hypothetical protein
MGPEEIFLLIVMSMRYEAAAEGLVRKNDPEGVAFKYEVNE